MSRHSFDPEVAARVGVNAAVLYQNIFFWVEKNAANGKNFKEGHYWTYNSYAAFAKLFPYLSPKQIRTALEKLVKDGLLIKGKFGDDSYDHTNWYSVTAPLNAQGQNDLPKRANRAAPKGKGSAPEGKSYKAPDNKPDRKPNMRDQNPWCFDAQFVPHGSQSFQLTKWREALSETGHPDPVNAFPNFQQGQQTGFLVPAQYPPNNRADCQTFLGEWLALHGEHPEATSC